MAHSLFAEINKYYGPRVETRCKQENILPYKVKCGGLKLKTLSELMMCSNVKKMEQAEMEWSKIKNVNSNAQKFVVQENIREKGNKTRHIPLKKTKKACDNDYLNKIHAKVIIHDTSAKISSKCPSKRCILDKAICGTQIYKHILKTKVRPFEIENNSNINSMQQLLSILELFQENHRVHNYRGLLRSIIQKNSLNKSCKATRKEIQKPWQRLDNYEITVKQMSTLVTQILIKVVPIELFGCYKNREIFTKLVCCLLRSTRFQPIYLKPYIEKLNIKKMAWLQPLEDESVQWLITIKLVKWLLLNYIMKILYKYIHVTIHPSAIGKRLYFPHYLWHRMKNHFIQENIDSKIFLPVPETNSAYWYPPICEYKLFMKNSGLRPIVKVMYKEEVPEMKLALQFLQQLCLTHYGLTSLVNFYDKWKTIVHRKSSSTCNKIWLVSCDLDDAYGSILLDQLNKIIKMLCKDLPARLNLKWIACLPYKHKDSEITYSKYFSDLHVVVPVGTLYTSVPSMNKHCKCYISKKTLLMLIEKCIFRQKVQIKNEDYLIGRGILQGTMLSNILFDIYYSYISHQRLSTFLKSGVLFRYVDDILYLTQNMALAIKFIERIKKGFTKYNCKFRSSKIQANFYYENNCVKNEITYLGWKINCDTLEILPYYVDAHPSHMFTVTIKNRKQNSSIKLLKNKLYNQSHLRLSRIILRDPTNFLKNLMFLVKKSAVMHAWRILLFTRKLFNNVHGYEANIFKVIKTSNAKILRALLKLYTRDIQKYLKINRKQMKLKILESMWTICRRVFFTDTTFRDQFGDLITEQMRQLKI